MEKNSKSRHPVKPTNQPNKQTNKEESLWYGGQDAKLWPRSKTDQAPVTLLRTLLD